ncbi:MAG: radical SAM protein [Anaerolineae bacterium]
MIRLALQAVSPTTRRPLTLVVRSQAINLQHGISETCTFDLAGRPVGAFFDGRNYRRGLDNRWLVKWTEGHPRERQRRWLTSGEARTILERMHHLARELQQAVDAGQVERTPQDPGRMDIGEGAREALTRVLRWDWPALETDRQRFLRVYKPIGILPPDQYLSLVLQATEGCWHNACTFCTFYRDRPFRIKSPAEFAAHIDAVLDFFGESIALRRTIFLGDANALVMPFHRLTQLLDVMAGRLTIMPGGLSASEQRRWRERYPDGFLGLYSFMDAFNVHRKSQEQWRQLAQRGLQRVYIGMETGDDALLRFLNKPGDAADVVEAVTLLKRAGVAVSVIILLGAGGERYFESHVENTVKALNAMPLDARDIIYFSDFVVLPGSEYVVLAAEAGIQPLSTRRMREQEAAIRARTRWRADDRGPRFSRYDIREFLY